MPDPPAASLSHRVAIVTGGGRGLGRSMALGLARAGCRVVVTGAREVHELERVADEGGGHVFAVTADVTRKADCERVVDAALNAWGRLDILVNNAARGMKYVSEQFLTQPTKFWEADPEVFRMVIDTNVNGPFLMTRAALPTMLRAGWGRIVNVSISRDTMQRAGFSPYGPSKAALESETCIWAKDLADTGVTVNAILPGGATLTGMIPDGVSDALRAKLLSPDIIVAPLLWLVSDETNAVTGKRVVATRFRDGAHPGEAVEDAGWGA